MVKWTRIIYLIGAWLFVAAVPIQMFLAGMVVVAGRMNWDEHRRFGAWVGLLVLIILITAYLGRLPVPTKRLAWLLLATFIIQVSLLFLRRSAPALSALHPVLGLADFALGAILAYRAVGFVREVGIQPSLHSALLKRRGIEERETA